MKPNILEVNGKTYIESREGKPVYTKDDGTEATLDPVSMLSRIGALNKEAGETRSERDSLAGKLKGFESINDPAAALAALELVSKIDQKKLVDSGKLDELKTTIAGPLEAKISELGRTLAEKDKAIAEGNKKYADEKVRNAFANSKFISEEIVIPAEILQASFGSRFGYENGKIVPYESEGRPLQSKDLTKLGETADFEEAIQIFVTTSPHKDALLRAPNASGSNTKPGQQKPTGTKTMRRSDFDALDHSARNVVIKNGTQLVEG